MSTNLCNVLRSPDEQECKKLSVVFRYGPNDSQHRLFTFNRAAKESLETMAKRMKINLQKAFGSKTDFQLKFRFADQATDVCDLATIPNKNFWQNGAQMIINDCTYVVRVNYPFIGDIRLSPVILTGYPTYPLVDLRYGRISQSKFVWYRQPYDGTEWIEIGHHEFTYHVSAEEDLTCRLKVVCTPRNDAQEEGIPSEAVSKKPIQMGPTECPFERRFEYTKPLMEPESNRFRVVSYNLLADLYADSEYSRDVLYSYCKNSYLDFEYRKPLLLKEMLGYHGDLYFLQEVDSIFYKRVLEPLFEIEGFLSNFTSKERSSEGLAIFYNKSKFNCLRQESRNHSDLLFNDEMFGFLREKIEQNQQLMERIKRLKNSFQIVLVESRSDPSRMIMLCNLHLYSKDDADHIRLFQAYLTLRFVEQECRKILEDSQNVNRKLAVIISGDFNSTPEWGVVKLAQNGWVDHTLEDFQSNLDEVVRDFCLEHGLQLDSACGFPKYTHYAQHFNGCLDYIWYDKVHFTVSEVVPMPSHEDVIRETALPNETIPSDHLPLICTLVWKS